MKHVSVIITMIIIGVLITPCLGTEPAEDYFAKGKTRIYKYIQECSSDTTYYKYSVEKDTVINGIDYHKIIGCDLKDGEDWWYLGYENSGRIYHIIENYDNSVLIPYEDYSLEEGEMAPYFNSDTNTYENYGLLIGKVQYLLIKGVTRKVMTINYHNGKFADFWVEGIGAVYSHYMCGQPVHGTKTLIGCYLDGVCLFDSDDIPLLSSVTCTETDLRLKIFPDRIYYDAGSERIRMILYDLNGSKVSEHLNSGILEIPTTSLLHGVYILEVSERYSSKIRKKILL